jgi:hypothetical protein
METFDDFPLWVQTSRLTYEVISVGLKNVPHVLTKWIKENRAITQQVRNATPQDTLYYSWKKTINSQDTVIELMLTSANRLYKEAELMMSLGVDPDEGHKPLDYQHHANTSKLKAYINHRAQRHSNNRSRNSRPSTSTTKPSSTTAITVNNIDVPPVDDLSIDDLTAIFQGATILEDYSSRNAAADIWCQLYANADADQREVLEEIENEPHNQSPLLMPGDEDYNWHSRNILNQLSSISVQSADIAGNTGRGPKGAPGTDPSIGYRHFNDRPYYSKFPCPICGLKAGNEPHILRNIEAHQKNMCPYGARTYIKNQRVTGDLDLKLIAQKTNPAQSRELIMQSWSTGCLSNSPRETIDAIIDDINQMRTQIQNGTFKDDASVNSATNNDA